MPDEAEERQVGLRVGVRVALGEVEAFVLGQPAHRLRLALAVDERAVDPPGVDPVHDLRPGPHGAVEAQHAGQDVRELGGGRRADVDPTPGILVLVRRAEHLRVDAREDAREHVGAEAEQVALAHSRQRLPDALADGVGAGVGRALEAEREVGQRVPGQLAPGHQTRPSRRARELEGGGPCHQGPIEVEEGSGVGSAAGGS